LTSSDDDTAGLERLKSFLLNARVRGASVIDRTCDLKVSFSNRSRLWIFCDHVPGSPSFEGNWELWLRDWALFVGTKSCFEVEPRRRSAQKDVPQEVVPSIKQRKAGVS